VGRPAASNHGTAQVQPMPSRPSAR
jgi:hypothetical protein